MTNCALNSRSVSSSAFSFSRESADDLMPEQESLSARGGRVLAGRKAIVTGATSGIGYDAAVRFKLEGANVALFARRKKALTRRAHLGHLGSDRRRAGRLG